MTALAILEIYKSLKNGTIKEFQPSVFIFGAKSAPSYKRAKAIIKFINEIADKINSDEQTNRLLKVVFVQNYNVSYAEKSLQVLMFLCRYQLPDLKQAERVI